MALLAQDTTATGGRGSFNAWSPGSDGGIWQFLKGTATLTFNGTQLLAAESFSGQIALTYGLYTSADVDILVRGSFGNASDILQVIARTQDGNNWYHLALSVTTLQIVRFQAGAGVNLLGASSLPITATAGTQYWLHFQVAGLTQRGSFYQDGNTDPGWQVWANDTAFPNAGQYGVGFNGGGHGNDNYTFDHFSVNSVTLIQPISTQLFPKSHVLNTRIDSCPVNANSTNYINAIGGTNPLATYFGTSIDTVNSPIGIPFVAVDNTQPNVPITYIGVSSGQDPGPWPIPHTAPIEGGPNSTGDRHVLTVNTQSARLYEMGPGFPQGDNSWNVGTSSSPGAGATWDLTSNALRPDNSASADAAGLPILPLLVRYDEVASGVIPHAIRVVLAVTSVQNTHIWPARHHDGNLVGTNFVPEGTRFRLKASKDISTFSATNQVILQAMKTYGVIVADRGPAPFSITGTPDSRWNNTDLAALSAIKVSDFEAVDETLLQTGGANSGLAQALSIVKVASTGQTVYVGQTASYWDIPLTTSGGLNDLTNAANVTLYFRTVSGAEMAGTGTLTTKVAAPAEILYKPSVADVANTFTGSLVIKALYPPSSTSADETIFVPIPFTIVAA